MESFIHHIEKWFLRNRPTSEYEFQSALDTQISHQTWIDSLLTVSLISEVEFHLQINISDELIYMMRNLSLREFLTRVDLEARK
jgi:acyl carrier protein